MRGEFYHCSLSWREGQTGLLQAVLQGGLNRHRLSWRSRLFARQHLLHACGSCVVQRILQRGFPLGGGHSKALLVGLDSSWRDRRQSRLLQAYRVLD